MQIKSLAFACVCLLLNIIHVANALADSSFTVLQPTVTPGVGEKIIDEFFVEAANQGFGGIVETALNGNLAGYDALLATQVNESLAHTGIQTFVTAMANSQAAMGRSLLFDVASNPQLFTLSLGLGLANKNFSLANAQNSLNITAETGQFPHYGVSVLPELLLGINFKAFNLPMLGPIDFSRLTLYTRVAYWDVDIQNIAVNMAGYGLLAQYKLLDEQTWDQAGLVRWNGLSVGSGFSYSSVTASFLSSLPRSTVHQNFQPGFAIDSIQVVLDWRGNVDLSMKLSTWTIPFEVATSCRLLKVLVGFVGAAADLNMGSAFLAAKATAPVNIYLRDPKKPQVPSLAIANPIPRVTLDGSYSPQFFDMRLFAGLQLNIVALAVFAQFGIDTTQNQILSAGARAFW